MSDNVIANQIYQGARACKTANHFLVSMRMPETATYADVCAAVQIVFDRENDGSISVQTGSRMLIIISEASGYSLSDLGA